MPSVVAIIDEDPKRAEAVAAALAETGEAEVRIVSPGPDLVARVAATAPDVLIVDVESPSRDIIDSLRDISRERPRPIVMFVDQSDDSMIAEAIDAGVSAYVIDGFNAKRVKAILDVAVARFRSHQALRSELDKAHATLRERKVIERAKGILMKRQNIGEEEAYAALRKLAMDQNKKLVEIAESVVSVAKLLGP